MLRTLLPNPAPRTDAVPPRASAWITALPLVLIALLYLTASVGPAIFDQNEGQYAGAVREMMDRPGDYLASAHGQLERGHWYIPTNDGIPRLQKPPLVYWVLTLSMRAFGVNEFAARLPNAVFSLLWFFGTFLLGQRLGGRRLGTAAATILGTMAGTFIFGHLIAPEPFLAAFLTLTFWCFVCACQEPARAGRWMFLAWIFMGLGVGSKGLHGALYPLAVAGLLAWRHPRTRPVWRQLLRPAGPLVVLALLTPWYACIARRYPGFLWDQFVNEQWGHVFNRRYPPDNDRVPLWIFCLEHFVLFLPWTFFIPAAWRSWRWGATGSERPEGGRSVPGAWFGVTAVTLLFSSLQDYYLMTAWTPVALFLARPWAGGERAGRTWPRWIRLGPGWALAAGGVAVWLAGWYLSLHGPGGIEGVPAASSNRDTMLTTLAGFSGAAWHQLLPLVWVTGSVLAAGGIGALLLAAGGRWQATLTTTAVMMVVLLGVAARGLGVLEDYFSLKRLALTVNRRADAGALVICVGEPNDNPSLLFYLNREIYWFKETERREFASRELKIGDRLFLSDAEFARQWESARMVFLICEADEMDRWRRKLGPDGYRGQVIEQRGTRVLVGNLEESRNAEAGSRNAEAQKGKRRD